ncbi:Serine/threonine-protein kinase rio2 [Leucoagaricus sp. SymC.cos]|nr:Serine/threonine-protein kinase rio2 [Leucoagaricus sp. SymC.cos]
MKLDATDLRYVSPDEFRVLTAVEMGSKNHEVVPTPLIAQISGLRSGGVNKLISSLAKRNLVSKVQNSKYDGYRLTYGGYDYLAMRALSKRDSIYSVGNQIGVGKESDIYVVADANSNEMVLKLHRLGRISFRAIKEKRDYLGKRKSASWMYMSRLAAQKEWAFMKVLHDHDFPVPRPIDQARHCILMEYIDAYPLRQVAELPSPGRLYSQLMDLIVRFAHAGLIHGDFNEFNILVRRESGEPVVIDFPQMVSTSHENAEWYFNRDVECIRTFFRRRFQYESVLYPRFSRTVREGPSGEEFRLDVMVAASGFGKKEMSTLEKEGDATKEEEKWEEEGEEGEGEEEGEEEEEEDDVKKGKEEGEGEVEVEEVQEKEGETPSLDGLSHRVQTLNLSDIRNKVTSDLSKTRLHQQRKYHSKRSMCQAGRPQGSKAKQDKKTKIDRGVTVEQSPCDFGSNSNTLYELHLTYFLAMDKADLETYQVQLSQVEAALSADPDNTELASLRSELQELIQLTEVAIGQAEATSSSKTEGSRRSATSTPAHTWSAGDECLAKYSKDNNWYPARITSLGGSAENRVYSIVFKGYNTTELVKAADLKPLPANYSTTAQSAAKAKEQLQKQASWQKFAKKSEKKGVHIAGISGTSIFKTPDNPTGKVGVTGSGRGMTEVASRTKHKFAIQDDEQ